MTRCNSMMLAASVAAVSWAAPASAQTGTPIEIPGTPYVQFENDLSQFGGFQEASGLNDIFGGGSTYYWTLNQWEEVNLPFDFNFYGEDISTINIGSHGVVTMSNETIYSHYYYRWAPGSGGPSYGTDVDGWIAPFWGYYAAGNPAINSSAGWAVMGTAPQRYLLIQYIDFANYYYSSTFYCPTIDGDRHCRWELDWQMRLYEGASGKIEIDYRMESFPSAYTLYGNQAIAGMESPQGDQPVLFLQSTPNASFEDFDNEDLNNKRLTLVQDPGVELQALTVDTPEFAPLGAEYSVQASLSNLNRNTLGPFDVTVEVSESVNFEPDETTEIGRNSLTLPPYQTRTVSVPATAPVELGERRYFHRVCMDAEDVIDEVNEGNNCTISEAQTRYLPSRPDLTVDRVKIPTRRAAPGDTLRVEITLSNIGSEDVADGTVSVMLSGNPTISPQDSDLLDEPISLAAGEETTVTLDVTLPTLLNSGAYYIGAFVDIDNEFEESNEANNGRAVDFELAIAGGDVAIITERIPNPLVGETYSAQFTAVGGDGDYRWSIVGRPSNDLPNPGLSLEPGEGLVFGVCQTPGAQTFEIRVESSGDADTADFTLDCVDPDEPLTIVTRDVPDGIIGQEYEFPLIVTGGASANPASLSWSATNLPMGIAITEDGVLRGTPTTPGTQVATVTVDDGTGTEDGSDQQQLTLNVRDNQNLLIEVAQLPEAELGVEYEAQIEASGGVGQIVFSQDGGTLPQGLVLNPNGWITGIPDQVGRFEFDVKAQDNPENGLRAQDRNRFMLDVVDPNQSFRVANDRLPAAVVGEAYNAAIAAVGGVPPIIWSIEGALPAGLEADQVEGSEEYIIRGTPENTDSGRFVVVTAVDVLDRTASKVLVISVVEPGEDIPQCPDPSDERCDDFAASEDDGGCAAVAGSTSSAFSGLVIALGLMFALRRRRRS